MTHRERMLATFRFEPVDRVPDWEFGAWQQTIERWHTEGLPAEYDDPWGAIAQYFGTDEAGLGGDLGLNVGLLPAFESKLLEEKGDHIIVQDGDGAIAEMLRPELGASIPHYLRYAIETRADWERLRDERLNPDSPGRAPADLEERCAQTHDPERPTLLWCGSVYGWIRNWMGLEGVSIAIAEDTPWVVEMMRHLGDLRNGLFERIAGKARIDCGVWWEDMCFNKGPLVSPRWFDEHMVPEYRRTTKLLREGCGCEFHQLDCDGNIHALVPGWLAGGVNVMYPVEAAHSDGHRIRAEFGQRVPLRGYFDKRALIAGKEAIDREFDRLRPLLEGGGFIPHTDHLVPPDVSWENYVHYRRRKCEFIGKEPGPHEAA